MATIGQTLAAARVAAGLTVADLSTRTRIREQVLRGIEREDFLPCGGDFYARGHIRGICRALGLDPAPLLDEFDREHARPGTAAFVPPARHPAAGPSAARATTEAARGRAWGEEFTETHTAGRGPGGDTHDPGGRSERWGHFERSQHVRGRVRQGRRTRAGATAVPGPRRTAEGQGRRPAGEPGPRPRQAISATRTRRGEAVRRHWPWAVVGVILLLGAFVGVHAWQEWEGGNPLRAAFDRGSDTVDSSVGVPAAPVPAERPSIDEPVPEEPKEITIAVTASDRSWVKVTDPDGEDLFTGFLLDGDTEEYVTEDTIGLWVGDAGVVSVAVDGEDLGALGRSGEVTSVTVGADGVEG
ncbi:helix-turn-helix domain-containing protein [Nocardiopsis sp. EMB25]|uniref:helix-turn-helix domain-containing protein n=1 Tax=Nocardiopsis TaxID=2013 RepID=UPI00034DE4D1|nr:MULTISPECIES: helix-turn-helix domain-containing protein [Nocardiopsis]MCY9782637.1 helix-turn-helix domain-containing protein [Nocardiopsis sp. EMB25]